MALSEENAFLLEAGKIFPGVKGEHLSEWLKHAINEHMIVAIVDAEGRMVHVNRHFCDVTGFGREELLGKRLEVLFRVMEPGQPAIWKSVQGGKTWRGIISDRTKDGVQFWSESTVVPFLDAKGTVLGYLVLRTDITRLKQSEDERALLTDRFAQQAESLEKTRSQFQTFFENAPIGFSWRKISPDGRQVEYHANQKFSELTGLSLAELSEQQNVGKVTPPEEWARQQELQRELYSGKRGSFSLEKRYIHPGGKEVWATLTVIVLRDKEGRVSNHFAMLENITARHAAEAELRSSESRWRTYLQTATEILYALTPEGKLKYVTPSVFPKLGYTEEELLGRELREIVHPGDFPMCEATIRETMETGKGNTIPVEYRVRHKDGSWKWHATTGTVYIDRNGQRAFFGVAHDISLRKRAQDQLKVALAQREELERIVNRSPSVVVLLKVEDGFSVEYVSESIRLFGYEPRDFTVGGRRYTEILYPEDLVRVKDELEAHRASGNKEYNQEYRVICADGSLRWVDDHTVVRLDAEGKVTHHELLVTDITERKKVEAQAKKLREASLAQAAAVQRHLCPHEFPDIGAVEIEAFSQPTAHVGGDYYDVLKVGPSHWGFVIADVAGKGPAAALMMAACRATLRLCALEELSPSKTLAKMNRVLHGDMPKGMFISIFYGILDLETGKMKYVRAGHEPTLLLRAGAKDAELLEAQGLALGFDGGEMFERILEEKEVQLERGDLVALYTDGITEAANAQGEEFGRDQFIATLAKHSGESLKVAVANLARHLERYSTLATRTDDRTLLLLRMR